MATTRELTAKLKAVSNIEDTLDDISDKAESASASFQFLGGSASSAGDDMDDAEDDAESLSESLNDITQSASAAIGALEGVESRTDEAGDEASESATEFSTLAASMASVNGMSLAMPDGGNISRRIETESDGIPPMGRIDRTVNRTVDIDTEVDDTSIFDKLSDKTGGLSLTRTVRIDSEVEQDSIASELKSKVPDLDLTRTVDVDSEVDDHSILGKLRDKAPDISLEALGISRAEAEAEELNDELSRTSRLATAASGALGAMGAITLGDRSSLPSPGSGDFNLPEFGDDRDRSFDIPFIGGRDRDRSILPDLPDIDFSKWSRGFSNIGSSASKAVGKVGEIGSGLAQVVGLGHNLGGLSKIASSLGSIGGSAGALTSVIGGLTGILALVGPVLGGLVSIAGALAGLVTGIVGLGAAVASIGAIGLFKEGKKRNPENPFKGIQEYLKGFQDDVRAALDPIFELEGLGQFVEGFISGGINSLADFSEMVSQLFPDIRGMFGRLGDVWSANQPEFFAQLEGLIRSMLPMIEGLMAVLIKSAPTVMKSMNNMGTTLLPKMARMFSSLWGVIEPFIPSGMALASILMDLVTIFAELITPVADLLGFALAPIFEALAWGVGKVADGTKWLSDEFSDLIGWFDSIMDAISQLTAIQVGKLIINLIIGAFESLTNAVIKRIQKLVNYTLGAMRQFVPGVKKGMEMGAIPEQIDMQGVDWSNSMSDVQPGVSGMQEGIASVDFNPDKPGNQGPNGQNSEQNSQDVYVDNLTVDATPDTNEARIKRLVKRGIQEAGQDSRQRTSGSQ